MDAIATQDLTKRYGRHPALENLSLRVPAGRLVGFLGPNGAGKTTGMRLLLGLLRPTQGGARVLGRDPWREGPALRADLGYLPGDVRLYEHLTGRTTVDFFRAARGRNSAGEIRRLTERFDLDLDRRVRSYSRGMKQKLGIVLALMHRPRLLILDEPTTGLDPLMREVLYNELRVAVADGRTVLFSSHTLAEVEELCDQVAILRAGRLVEWAAITDLRRRALRRVEVHFAEKQGKSGASCARASDVPENPKHRSALPSGLRVTDHCPNVLRGVWTGPPGPLLDWLASQAVQDVTIAPPDPNDLFMTYYRDHAAGREAIP